MTDSQAANQTEDAEQDGLHNTILSATFKHADSERGGYVFQLKDDHKALVSFEELGKDAAFDDGQEVNLLVEQEVAGLWVASLKKAQKLQLWDHYAKLASDDATIEGVIVSQNAGGVSVDAGIRAFVPKSHIDLHRVDDASSYLGRKETFRILEFKRDQGELVLSRRKHLESQQKVKQANIAQTLEPGAEFDGIVRGVKPYGAFVDIGGGLQGLLHVSNMTWGRLDSATELMRPGDEVRVVVLDYDPEKKRLGLGRKQLLKDPWDNTEFYSVGDVLTGKIVSLADFGAFVEISPGLEGLVHVSEISWTKHVNKPSDFLEAGQDIAVRVVEINREDRRLSLSIRQLEDNPWDLFAERVAIGTRRIGPIKNITDFGLFVEIEDDIQGLVHVSNISWTEHTNKLEETYSVGQDIEVIVLDVDPEVQRLELGIKQLSDNPWDVMALAAKPGNKIKGVVSRVTTFGAFVTLSEGIEGLIHISELSLDRVEDVMSVVRPGQEVEALVLSFDKPSERIALSLKRDTLEEEEVHEYDEPANATSTLGDILRAQLGVVSAEEE